MSNFTKNIEALNAICEKLNVSAENAKNIEALNAILASYGVESEKKILAALNKWYDLL